MEKKKSKENGIGEQYSEKISENLRKNHSERAYQMVKDLTTVKQGKATAIQDCSGNCLTHTEQYRIDGQNTALSCTTTRPSETHQHWIVPRLVVPGRPPHFPQGSGQTAIQSLRKGKSTGVDNIPAELVQAGGDDVITALTTIFNKIWQTGEWPTPSTQSLVMTLPKKGNLQQCQNYGKISLISHPSKFMLKITLNRLKL